MPNGIIPNGKICMGINEDNLKKNCRRKHYWKIHEVIVEIIPESKTITREKTIQKISSEAWKRNAL